MIHNILYPAIQCNTKQCESTNTCNATENKNNNKKNKNKKNKKTIELNDSVHRGGAGWLAANP